MTQMHGQGAYQFPNGAQLEGKWGNGKPTGKVTVSFRDMQYSGTIKETNVVQSTGRPEVLVRDEQAGVAWLRYITSHACADSALP